MNKIPVVLIFGPTGVGKTELLLSPVFKNCEIINADSMQVYRGMDIGTAKPGPDFLRKVKHHLIDIKDPSEQFHAGEFVETADATVNMIHSAGKIAVICGGTGFYFKNFIYGLPESPPSDSKVRKTIEDEFVEKGGREMLNRLKLVDPVSAKRINPNDNYRVLRALEVYTLSGQPLSSFTVPVEERDIYRICLIGLNRKRPELYERINKRVDAMISSGLEEEINSLVNKGYTENDPGMQGIGYKEFFIGKNEGLDLSTTAELIKRNSRRYAKRQITWFRQLKNINWFSPEDIDGISGLISSFLKK
jgi:tRNA dimethylallyltransferase